jgi:hypothetical protein
MHQRKAVWQALKRAGVFDSDDAQLREFAKFLRKHPTQCWREYVSDFRDRFYTCFDEVVPALAKIDDPQIRGVLIKYSDPNQPKERELLAKAAREIDPKRDPVAIKRLAKLKLTTITGILLGRPLPEKLRAYVARQ